MARRVYPPFTSALSKTEAILVLAWLPVHLWLLPWALSVQLLEGRLHEPWASVLYYAIGCAWLVAVAFRFLRRDFDPLIERPLFVAGQVAGGYLSMLACNLLAGMLLAWLAPGAENLNQSGVEQLIDASYGPMKAALIYLGPITEELLFRAGLFGVLRRRRRLAAYAVSMLAFGAYHVWGFALTEPVYWLFLLQYLPAGWLLARCYECTNSIWGSICFHMLTNAMALSVYTEVLNNI